MSPLGMLRDAMDRAVAALDPTETAQRFENMRATIADIDGHDR